MAKHHEVLKKLLEGHGRFHASADKVHLEQHSKQHKPIAAVLSCSDARVPVEHILSCGIGELFVVRNAGNVADEVSVQASLEYAVNHLGVPLIVVLGHTNCGAVKACMEGYEHGHVHGMIGQHVSKIEEAVIRGAGDYRKTVEENVRLALERLGRNEALKQAVSEERLGLVGCVYDIETGRLEVLE